MRRAVKRGGGQQAAGLLKQGKADGNRTLVAVVADVHVALAPSCRGVQQG